MAAPGRSRFACWNITRVGLWLLCNMHFVQITQRTHLQDLADLKERIIAAVKNIDALILTRVCGKNLNTSYRCVPCHPWCTHQTSLVICIYIYIYKLFQFSCGCRFFGFLVINVCKHGEHYGRPCTQGVTGGTDKTSGECSLC